MEDVFTFEWELGSDENRMREAQLEGTVFNCLDFCLLKGKNAHFFLRSNSTACVPELWHVLELLHEENVSFTLLSEPENTAFDRICADHFDKNRLILRSDGMACWEGKLLGSVLEDRLADMWDIRDCEV